MKKILVALALLIIVVCLFKSKTIIIPKEAIRFRIIAHSNEVEDQNLKKEIIKDLKTEIRKLDIVPKSIEINREVIKANIPNFYNVVNQTLQRTNSNKKFTIEYGLNYFPKKEYKGVVYEEGEYESLVIKLGDGEGDNFWCVLFPPLCLLEGEEENHDSVEYTSFIKELIDKYF